MAVARRILEDPSMDPEQNPAVDSMMQPTQPDIPFTSAGGNDQPQQQPIADYGSPAPVPQPTRAPADVSFMSNAPAGATSIMVGDHLPTTPVSTGSTPAKSYGAAPPGFDPNKWADPNHQSIKYVVGRILAGGGTIQQAASAVGGQVTGADTMFIPGDGEYDALFDQGGPGQHAQWEPTGRSVGSQTFNPAAVQQGAGQPGGGGATGGGTTNPNLAATIKSILTPGYAPPGNGGVYGNGNLQQVGNDPFSQLIDSGIAGVINNEGKTPLGSDLEATIRGILDRGGKLNPDTMQGRFESARELENKAFRSQLNDARGALANRGLLSEPGQPSGAEAGSVRRITEGIAPEFARNIRDIATDETTRSDDRLMQSLTLATGMSRDQANTLLQATQQGTDRQKVLADVALKSLDQNIAWNKFIAQFGLDRDRLLYEIESGNAAALMPLLAMFQSQLGTSTSGYV